MTELEAVAMDTGKLRPELPGRWNHIRKLIERSGPFAHPDFEPTPEILDFMMNTCRVLVVGAGGLGCEMLKDLALMGFGKIDVIDMDTIDLSNLNRQFLFRLKDVGKPKANVAAEFIQSRVPHCCVTPHFKKIQDYDDTFYRQFHIVINGLDSVIARRWMNSMMLSLLIYEDGILDPTSIVPMIDGGTEGFKGNVRVILPGVNACIECTLNLYPPQMNFPMCTIAHTPRLPEHCIEFIKVFLWPQENPFGKQLSIDGDDPIHIQWIYEKAQERADNYNIPGVTYRLTQGVVKHIIPAVASTNATIAAQCVTEAFKIASSCCKHLNNYMVYNDADGLYASALEVEKLEDCAACSQVPRVLRFPEGTTLQNLIDHLIDDASLQMKSPGITTTVDGKNKTLYMRNPEAIRVRTKQNLPKTLKDLGLIQNQEIYVADVTTRSTVIFTLSFTKKCL